MKIVTFKSNETENYIAYSYVKTITGKQGMIYTSDYSRIKAMQKIMEYIKNPLSNKLNQ